MQFITTLVALCAAASAITITSPPRDNSPRPVQYNNGSITITWTSSPGEPTSLDVVLSTNNGQSLRTVASGIPTSAGSYAVDLAGVAPGQNYAVNLNNNPASGSSGILAQSGTFTVAQGEVASSSSAAASSSAALSSSMVASSAAVTSSGSAMSTSAGESVAAVPTASVSGSASASGSAGAATTSSGAASSTASGASASGSRRASGTSAGAAPSSTTASGATTLQAGSLAVAAVGLVSYFL